MTLYLAIDQGSHATRALALDEHGAVHARAFVDIDTRRTGDDRVEHDADELDASLDAACRALFDRLGADRHRLVAAGLATQRSSIVCWDTVSDAPLSPVLSWRDRRAAAQIAALAGEAGTITELTGLVLSPHYGASKMRWCLDHIDAVQSAARHGRLAVGPLSSFLIRRICGGRSLADPANASRTLLWDRKQRRFSARLCRLFGIDPNLLPASVASAHSFGTLRIDDVCVPLTVVTGDQSAALYAFGAPRSDAAYVNIGTGAFFQRPVGGRPLLVPGLLSSVVWQDAAAVDYVVEGTVNGAASALHAHADERGADAHALVQAAVAAPAPDVPLYLNGIGGLAAPYWLADFASEFVGSGAGPGGTLAVLESIAFLLAVNLAQAERRLPPATRLLVTGGLASVDYLCQCLADVSGRPVERAREEEATCRGLTFLTAGAPSGWRCPPAERSFAPAPDAPARERYARWRDAMADRGARLPPAG